MEGGTYTTDENGEILIENLDWGQLPPHGDRVRGLRAPAPAPELHGGRVQREGRGGAREGGRGAGSDEPPEAHDGIHREDRHRRDGADTKVPVDGAEYGLFTEDGDQVATDWTDDNGRIEFTGVLYGKYYVKELTAAAGYAIDTEEHHFEITREYAGRGRRAAPDRRSEGRDAHGHQAGCPGTPAPRGRGVRREEIGRDTR